MLRGVLKGEVVSTPHEPHIAQSLRLKPRIEVWRKKLEATLSPRLARGIEEAIVQACEQAPLAHQMLVHWERLLMVEPVDSPWWVWLAEQPRVLEMLLRVFGSSEYLSDTLIRFPSTRRVLIERQRLGEVLAREEFIAQALERLPAGCSRMEVWDALRLFQREQLVRIGVCDAFGLFDLRTVTLQLSLLADALVQLSLRSVLTETWHPPTNLPFEIPGFCVLALGKLGGEELNYSSDIDLLFLAREESNRWVGVAQQLMKALQTLTNYGFLYRVDMRLRPWGRTGPLVSRAEGYLHYLRRDASLWEHQALLKARIIAGDVALGEQTLAQARPLIFAAAPSQMRHTVRETRQRMEKQLLKQGRSWGDVKSGAGSLRDIEFLVQLLQWQHAAEHPWLLTTNTLEGLQRLTETGFLTAADYRHLREGYVLLRTLEHALQLMHNQAEHRLPDSSRALEYLAQRLDFPSGETLLEHYQQQIQQVRALFIRYVGQTTAAPLHLAPTGGPSVLATEPPFTPLDHQRHRELLRQLTPSQPVLVSAELQNAAENSSEAMWQVTVVGCDQPGDLSMICGLLFVYGCDIVQGWVSTGNYPDLWEHLRQLLPTGATCAGRDFVDRFVVRAPCSLREAEWWQRYEHELQELFLLARSGRDGEAQGQLARRVAAALEAEAETLCRLAPLSLELHTLEQPPVTRMEIRGEDSPGFLYELTNALALTGVQIEAMTIRTVGQRVWDSLQITEAATGQPILGDARQSQLKTAVVLIKHFTHLLPRAPNPEAALLHFRAFLRDWLQRPDWSEQLSSLERPEVLAALAQLLGVSDFLWEDFLRLQAAHLFPLLRDIADLQQRHSVDALRARWQQRRNEAASIEDAVAALNDYKDREMFRIDMRHILGLIPNFEQFAEELTDLADVVVQAASILAWEDVFQRQEISAARAREVAWCVVGLGKYGGRELGFASDIELMFLYGPADPVQPLAAEWSAWCDRVVERIQHFIWSAREGIFQVDLRLRPYGRAGTLAVSLEAFEKYFRAEGPAWPYERQALVKMRPVAGDHHFGQRCLELRDRLIFRGERWDREAVRGMRERQIRRWVKPGTFHAKLSAGGVVDVEYLVQVLQLEQGHRAVGLRTPSTLAAIQALAVHGILQPDDARDLQEAYLFLRRLIDALRMVRGHARDLTLPAMGSEDYEFLIRRLGMSTRRGEFPLLLEQHTRRVMQLGARYLS
ncbi:MAG: hypothetical protein KatS3mg114_1063 [Planctomycetaceae bacterium]|nr:MAG: hypothetical protein KatS3mg114_1063 [Planctomycetaceae bacterium]